MKFHTMFLLQLVGLVCLGGFCFASEATYPLITKLSESDVVAIVRVKGIETVDMASPGHRMMTFALEVGELIKGEPEKNISVREYSKNATAGFSGLGIEKESLFLAYLRKNEDGTYRLTRNTNQYFEAISAKTVYFVKDVGQTTHTVPLVES